MARAPIFDEAALAAAGVRVIRRSGWPAVTVRSVAEELGVSPMALYRLAPDADRLRLLVANAVAPPLPSPVGPLTDVLRSWAVDAYAHLRGLPGVASYVVLRWTELPAWLDVVEALLAAASACRARPRSPPSTPTSPTSWCEPSSTTAWPPPLAA